MSESQFQKSKRIRRTKEQIAELDELFIKEVQVNKDLLFGQLSSTITAAMKNDKWEEIRKMLVEKGDKLLVNKNADYVKSTHWQKLRKNTVERVDFLKVKTGEEPKEDQLSSVSFKIFNEFYSNF
jgi:hypothetical protein